MIATSPCDRCVEHAPDLGENRRDFWKSSLD
jgi:hypothetical protein